MKKLITSTLGLVCVVSAFGQGAVNFNNRVTGAGGVVAPVYGPEPGNPTLVIRGNATTNGGSATYTGPLLLGTGFTAELWGGPSGTAEGSLQLISSVKFRTTTTFGGFIQPPALAPTVAGVAGGAVATMQIRAYDNKGGTVNDWATALARADVASGTSSLFNPPALQEPPNTPPNMVGLQSFNLHVVPEPSVIGLGVLGIGALLLRRRK